MKASSKLSIFLTASLKLNIGKFTNLSLKYNENTKNKTKSAQLVKHVLLDYAASTKIE
jgi:hypothetical protein